ncbi:hypothetical protein [Nitrosomonas sp.]|uniref:hypothetical protein n=1 Tax=Nitrosomonas sp. TaxID=42353 RepID=UPI0025FD4E4F|nr:hypothetical protein [Nitrosomonas sp.]
MSLATRRFCVSPQKTGILPVEGGLDPKKTNEISTFIPLLEGIDIQGKDITTRG